MAGGAQHIALAAQRRSQYCRCSVSGTAATLPSKCADQDPDRRSTAHDAHFRHETHIARPNGYPDHHPQRRRPPLQNRPACCLTANRVAVNRQTRQRAPARRRRHPWDAVAAKPEPNHSVRTCPGRRCFTDVCWRAHAGPRRKSCSARRGQPARQALPGSTAVSESSAGAG